MTKIASPHKMTSSRDYVNEYSCVFAIDIAFYTHKDCGITLEEVSMIAKKDIAFIKSHVFHLTSSKSSSEHHTVTDLRIEGDKYFINAKNFSLSFDEACNYLAQIAKNCTKLNLSQEYIKKLKAFDKEQVNMLSHSPSDVKLNSKTYDLRKIISK